MCLLFIILKSRARQAKRVREQILTDMIFCYYRLVQFDLNHNGKPFQLFLLVDLKLQDVPE